MPQNYGFVLVSWMFLQYSFSQIVNASQTYLSPLILKSSFFQPAEARRFTVSKGIRRLLISFEEVTPTSVFAMLITRKCEEGGHFRAILDINGIQRFDEFLTENSRILRVLSHSGDSGILTFLDTEKCNYEIKVEQDWKNTYKLLLLEWIGKLPILLFISFCCFATSHALLGTGLTTLPLTLLFTGAVLFCTFR